MNKSYYSAIHITSVPDPDPPDPHVFGGTPTKRQVSKRQVSKRLVSKRPAFF